ncbi:MAG: hypothetical protein U0401_04560 [Anaerolineae bacterium]
MAISDNMVVVGAYGDDFSFGDQGSAYVFVKPMGGWGGILTSGRQTDCQRGQGGDQLGYAVAISGVYHSGWGLWR